MKGEKAWAEHLLKLKDDIMKKLISVGLRIFAMRIFKKVEALRGDLSRAQFLKKLLELYENEGTDPA